MICIFTLCRLSLSKNEEIAPNRLGNAATVCSARLCPHYSSLDMWINIRSICYNEFEVSQLSEVHKSQIQTRNEELDYLTSNNNSDFFQYSPHQLGMLAALMSVLGLVAGYFAGETHNKQDLLPASKRASSYSPIVVSVDHIESIHNNKMMDF